MNGVLALRTTGLDRLAFREFDKLGERDGGQRFFPFPLCLVFQPQLNGSCGRCNDDPRKNLQTVGVDNVQRVLKRNMLSVATRTEGAGKDYVTNHPIVICAEREGMPRNQTLSTKKMGCENVQNSALHGTIGDKQALPRSCDHIPGV